MGWALVLVIIYQSLTPHPVEFEVAQGDKYLHVLAYLALSSWFANIYERWSDRLLCAAGCLALGIGLEFAQLLTATRSFEVADMGADAAGVVIGMALAPPRLPNYLRFTERVAASLRHP